MMIQQEIFTVIPVLLGTIKIHMGVDNMMMLTLLLQSSAVHVEEDAVLQKTVGLKMILSLNQLA
jgi:hypothetical protein